MSLPSKWISQVKLGAGDEIFVEEKGKQLIVSKAADTAAKHYVEVDLTGMSKGIVYSSLENLYIRGEDEMRLRFDDPKTYEAVADAVSNLLGFQIVEHSAKGCVAKELARGDGDDFDKLLRRIFLLLLTVADDGIEAYKTNNTDALVAIHQRDRSINTLCTFCMRVLNKQQRVDLEHAMHMYTLLTLLEHLGDQYSRLYRDVKSIQPNTIKHAQKVASLLRDFYTLFYSFSKEGASALKEKRDSIRSILDKAVEETKSKNDIIALHHLRSIADLIVDIEKFHLAMQL
jgi:phosphate uptake regulator